MSSVSQYIEIFDGNKDLLEKNSAQFLNSFRNHAAETLKTSGLPKKGDEGYEKTSIDEMFAPDFGINIARINIPVNLAATFRCDVPNLSTWLGVTINDDFHPVGNLEAKLPKGILFMSFKEAEKNYPQLLDKYGTVADINDPKVAINSMLVQDGVLIYIPKGVHLEKPLQLVNIFSSPTPLLAARRLLIIAEDDSKMDLLVCDHTQDNEHRYLSSEVVEIIMGKNANVNYYCIEESSQLTSRTSSLYAHQDDGSRLETVSVTLSCGVTRNDFDITIDGHHCDTRLNGMAIGSGKQHIDNASLVKHIGESCRSNQIFKYVLDDDATGAFEGMIRVDEKARFTEAYQSNKNILADPGARMHSKPQLLIYCDDVKCSHGATTGQLSQEALFYMRSRGIPEKVAKTMLMEAFMADVIAGVGLDTLRDRLRHLVEKRFHGVESFCGTCSLTTSGEGKPNCN